MDYNRLSEKIVVPARSQTPFGFGGGLDYNRPSELRPAESRSSQTPFGVGGGVERGIGTASALGLKESQTPFGFGGGLDAVCRVMQDATGTTMSQTPFGFGGGLDTGTQYSLSIRKLQALFGMGAVFIRAITGNPCAFHP